MTPEQRLEKKCEFLFFEFHNWGKWSNSYVNKVIYWPLSKNPINGEELNQKRVCLNCGKEEIRVVS